MVSQVPAIGFISSLGGCRGRRAVTPDSLLLLTLLPVTGHAVTPRYSGHAVTPDSLLLTLLPVTSTWKLGS